MHLSCSSQQKKHFHLPHVPLLDLTVDQIFLLVTFPLMCTPTFLFFLTFLSSSVTCPPLLSLVIPLILHATPQAVVLLSSIHFPLSIIPFLPVAPRSVLQSSHSPPFTLLLLSSLSHVISASLSISLSCLNLSFPRSEFRDGIEYPCRLLSYELMTFSA